MVAPNPKVRIAPSGPLADNEDPPYNALFTDYSGYTFIGSTAQGGESSGDAGVSDDFFSARIGPTGTADRSVNTYLHLAGRPVAPAQVDASLAAYDSFRPFSVNPDDDLALTPGVWLVECELSLGYATATATANDYGVLSSVAYAFFDNNTVATAQNAQVNSIAPKIFGSQNSMTTLVFELTITEALIGANGGNPIRGLGLQLTRESGAGTSGDYTANSGWLQFGRDSKLKVRKYRELDA